MTLTATLPRNASKLVSYRPKPAVQNAETLWKTADQSGWGSSACRKARNRAATPAVSAKAVNRMTLRMNFATRNSSGMLKTTLPICSRRPDRSPPRESATKEPKVM